MNFCRGSISSDSYQLRASGGNRYIFANRALGRRPDPYTLAKPSAPLGIGRHGLRVGPFLNGLQSHGPTSAPGAALISQQ